MRFIYVLFLLLITSRATSQRFDTLKNEPGYLKVEVYDNWDILRYTVEETPQKRTVKHLCFWHNEDIALYVEDREQGTCAVNEYMHSHEIFSDNEFADTHIYERVEHNGGLCFVERDSNNIIRATGQFDNNGFKHGQWYYFDRYGLKSYQVNYDHGNVIQGQNQGRVHIVLPGMDKYAQVLAVSENGNYALIKQERMLVLVNAVTKEIVKQIPVSYLFENETWNWCMLSNNGRFLGASNDANFTQYKIFDLNQEQVVYSVQIPSEGLWNLAFSPNDSTFMYSVVMSHNGEGAEVFFTENIFTREQKKFICEIDATNGYGHKVTFSEDGERVYVLNDQYGVLTVLSKDMLPIDTLQLPAEKSFYRVFQDYVCYIEGQQLVIRGVYPGSVFSTSIKLPKDIRTEQLYFQSYCKFELDTAKQTLTALMPKSEGLPYTFAVNYEDQKFIYKYPFDKYISNYIEQPELFMLPDGNLLSTWLVNFNDTARYGYYQDNIPCWYDPGSREITYSGLQSPSYTVEFSAQQQHMLELSAELNGMHPYYDAGLRYYLDLSTGDLKLLPLSDTSYIPSDTLPYCNPCADDIYRFTHNPLEPESNMELQVYYSHDEKSTFSANYALSFHNANLDQTHERFVKFILLDSSDYLLYCPDKYYMGTPGATSLINFEVDLRVYPFEQFDLKYNRPDIVLERIGYADSALINAYHLAYLRRLKKMNFTEDMLQDDFHLPELEIENFEKMPSITNQSEIDLNIRIEDSKYPIDRINVWVNDVAVYGVNGISLRDKMTQHYQAELTIPLTLGTNKIQLSALNQAGAESYKKTFTIESTQGKKTTDLYLVTMGVSNYQDSRYNLTYAAKDARDMVGAFEQSKFYENVYTKCLTDERVTLENLDSLKSFFSRADINDQVIIFVAGHGVLDANFDYYYASYDMDFSDPSKRGISYSLIESLLDGIKPLKKLLFMDTCHSGEVDKEDVQYAQQETSSENDIVFRNVGVAVENKENQLGLQNTSELMKSLFTDLRKGTGATVISSAGGVEFAMESDQWKNGLFTYCLINGLTSGEADLNHDKQITIAELQLYIQTKVNTLSHGKQTPTSRIENKTLDYRIW